MAVNSIAAPPDEKRDAAAERLAPSVPAWPLYTLKRAVGAFPAGTVFRRAPSCRDPKVRYLVNNVACQCPDYQRAGYVCKHVRAVIRYEEKLRQADDNGAIDLAFAEVATRLRGNGAGAAILKTYEAIYGSDE